LQPVLSSAARPAHGLTTGEDAGFWPRLAAYLIDGVIVTLVAVVIVLPFGGIAAMLARKSPGLAVTLAAIGYLLVAVMSIGYPLYFWATRGATPGKKMLHLKVIREDGVEPMGYGKAALRLVGYVCSSILYIGFIMIFFTERHRGLHDMIAGTLVIKTL